MSPWDLRKNKKQKHDSWLVCQTKRLTHLHWGCVRGLMLEDRFPRLCFRGNSNASFTGSVFLNFHTFSFFASVILSVLLLASQTRSDTLDTTSTWWALVIFSVDCAETYAWFAGANALRGLNTAASAVLILAQCTWVYHLLASARSALHVAMSLSCEPHCSLVCFFCLLSFPPFLSSFLPICVPRQPIE